MFIASVQTSPSPDFAENLEKAKYFGIRSAKAGADVVVFPEMFMSYPVEQNGFYEHVSENCEDFDKYMIKMAYNNSVNIIYGGWEPDHSNRKVYNTVKVVDRSGQVLVNYKKIHLFDALSVNESDFITAGSEISPVIELAGVKAGVGICYDLRFPEYFRQLAINGAELVILPSAWYSGYMKEDHWITLLKARAIENTFFMAGVNLCGDKFCSRSTVVSPFGEILSSSFGGEGTVYTEINPEKIEETRVLLPSLKNRRLI